MTREERMREFAKLRLPALQIKYLEIVGEETRCPNKTYLLRRIEETLEAQEATTEIEAEGNEAGIMDANERENIRQSLKGLHDVERLHALYVEVVGRTTKSTNVAYLKWKIKQALAGKISTAHNRLTARDNFKVIPIRLPVDTINAIDDAWKRHGHKNRMALFRQALADYFISVNESELAQQIWG